MFTSRQPIDHDLQPFIESIWIGTSALAHKFELILPIPTAQLLINLIDDEFRDYDLKRRPRFQGRGACIIGPTSEPKFINTSSQAAICGIKFRLGGFYGLFGWPVDALFDRVVDIEDIWGLSARTLRNDILAASTDSQKLDIMEKFVLTQMRTNAHMDPNIMLATSEIESGRDIRELSIAKNMSARKLITLFRTQTGLSPKMLGRLMRFQNLVKTIELGRNWSDHAFEHGFADQSHMIREFRRFAGITPTVYQMRSPDDRNHMIADML